MVGTLVQNVKNNDCSLQTHLYGWYVGSEFEEEQL